MIDPESLIPEHDGPVVAWYWQHYYLKAEVFPTVLGALRFLGELADTGDGSPDVVEADGEVLVDEPEQLYWEYVEARAALRRAAPDYVEPVRKPTPYTLELKHPTEEKYAELGRFETKAEAVAHAEGIPCAGDRLKIKDTRR